MDKERQFELERLKKENLYLKKLLSYIMQHGNHHAFAVPPNKILTRRSLPEEKIALFKYLFKGRSDTYAVRWEAKNGKSGYAPACQMEWQKPICRKPDTMCSECGNRQLLPLTDQVLYDHLSGKKTIGLYPLQKDDTCSLLVLDFDKKDWQKDVAAFVQVCSIFQVPVNIERSRSGNGAHVWIFFTENIPAALARKLGHALLETARKMRPDLAFDSFDRMLPNQDTLSKRGFGNLIALPLQLHSKEAGNSLFVDQTFTPYPDQWLYLSTITRLSENDILKTLDLLGFDKENKVLPEKITIRLKNGMHIKKNELSDALILELKKISSFHNPAYYKAQAQRKSTYHLQKVIQCYDENEEMIILPRGCRDKLKQLLDEHDMKAEWVDETYEGEAIDIKFHGSLTPLQEEALQQFTLFQNGVLSAPTGFGKTVLAAALMAKNKTNTLIIVDRTQLQQQWIEKLSAFLDILPEEIGQIGGGKKKPTGIIDVATIQSLQFKGQTKSVITQYGQVIVDECHHISAFTFEKILKNVRAKYIYGLSATPIRKDGLHPIIFMQCGSIRYKIDARTQAKIRPFIQKLIARKTNFTSSHSDIQTLYKQLAENDERNNQIFNDVLLELEAGRSPIILTERIEHVKNLESKFKGFVKNLIVLFGDLSKKERKLALERLANIPDDSERLIIATGKFIGEGFDDSRLDTLFLAMPISWKGTLQQYTGRLHRNHVNKEEVKVYDYVDIKVPVFKHMYAKRLKGYRAMGYAVTRDEKGKPEQMRLF